MPTDNTRASKRAKAKVAEDGQSLHNGNGGTDDYYEVEEVLQRRVSSSGSDSAGRVVEYRKFFLSSDLLHCFCSLIDSLIAQLYDGRNLPVG
jgi:hypothetical protein